MSYQLDLTVLIYLGCSFSRLVLFIGQSPPLCSVTVAFPMSFAADASCLVFDLFTGLLTSIQSVYHFSDLLLCL